MASSRGSGIVSARIRAAEPSYEVSDKKILYVFPGQGSQSVGMLASLAQRPEVAGLLATADRVLDEPISRLIAAMSASLRVMPAFISATRSR